jgi:hypothetical protein
VTDGSFIEDYLASAGGQWCKVENTAVGDAVLIQEVYLDDTTYDKPYIVGVGTHEPSGETRKVRLSVSNVKRIYEVLGRESDWVGNRIRCLAHQPYPGLSKSGILWTGERVYVPSKLG